MQRTRRNFLALLASIPLVGTLFRTADATVTTAGGFELVPTEFEAGSFTVDYKTSPIPAPKVEEKVIVVVWSGVVFSPVVSDVTKLNVYPIPDTAWGGDRADTKHGTFMEQETRRPDGTLSTRPHQFRCLPSLIIGTPEQIVEAFREKLYRAYRCYTECGLPDQRPAALSPEQWEEFQRTGHALTAGGAVDLPFGKKAEA